ncbi:MAG: hypothetical protein IKU81_03695 [Oscillibacter sp.]|nr:hypothetical protein [Oscillibacter sp.]
MKKLKKIFLYTYRILLFVAIIAAITALFSKVFFLLLKTVASIYLPYSAWFVFFLILSGGIWAIVTEINGQKERKKQLATLAEVESPNFQQELKTFVEDCLSKYSYMTEQDGDHYTVILPDPSRFLQISVGQSVIETQIFIGGWDEGSYYANSSEEFEELKQAFSLDLHDWLHDRTVQVAFITDEKQVPYSFICAVDNIEEIISKNLKSFSYHPWWIRILYLIFLIPPPKPVSKIQVFSANGVHDQIISIK